MVPIDCGYREANRSCIQTRIAPSATHLMFDSSPHRWPTERFEALLKSLTAESTTMPFLTDIRIKYSGGLPSAEMDFDVVSAFITARGVRTLALPAGWEVSAEALKKEFNYLEVRLRLTCKHRGPRRLILNFCTL